ncbi:hypothetical protein EDL79_03775 [Ehrlichia ruminantium]|uniref:Uncharacterized protein n=1 Tax=Ehrlichia ruminantium TaxID=779 RepID=A0AAE6Q983_EHRRU|nr:hypothetical protein EDL81_03765 [Ehrlichia ruminantium]QGR03654.1 hypothetical protein EDL80_03765 [Ehrlichia ruminantium]QGR04581.1 hypothetical protein EDL79_03775 [Ehrlichia ruminantium]
MFLYNVFIAGVVYSQLIYYCKILACCGGNYCGCLVKYYQVTFKQVKMDRNVVFSELLCVNTLTV